MKQGDVVLSSQKNGKTSMLVGSDLYQVAKITEQVFKLAEVSAIKELVFAWPFNQDPEKLDQQPTREFSEAVLGYFDSCMLHQVKKITVLVNSESLLVDLNDAFEPYVAELMRQKEHAKTLKMMELCFFEN